MDNNRPHTKKSADTNRTDTGPSHTVVQKKCSTKEMPVFDQKRQHIEEIRLICTTHGHGTSMVSTTGVLARTLTVVVANNDAVTVTILAS